MSYAAIDLIENGFLGNTPVYDVPAGNYFVLGDNLDNSVDSRMMDQMGYVPFENLIGPVEIHSGRSIRVRRRANPICVRVEFACRCNRSRSRWRARAFRRVNLS